MRKYVYDVTNYDVISLKGECIVSFRTYISSGRFMLEYETESRDYDTSYRLKIKETHSRLPYKSEYFIQVRRM